MQNICGSAGCSSAAPQPLLTGLALLRNHPRDHGDGLGRGWLSASTGRVELLLWVAAVTAATTQTNPSIDHLSNPLRDHRLSQ